MRNESDYIYYFSSEQKSEPKHAAVKCAPKHLKKHRHIRAIHLFALCYLLIAAMLMSTSVSFAKFTETSPTVTANSVSVASFNYTVNQITGDALEKIKTDPTTRDTYDLSDSDVVVCAFEVSNADEAGNVSDVALSCDVNLSLHGSVNFYVTYDSDVGTDGGLLFNSEADHNNFDALTDFKNNGQSKFIMHVIDNSSSSIINECSSDVSAPPILSDNSALPMPMIQISNMPLSVDLLFNPKWENKIEFPVNHEDSDKDTYTCIITLDTSDLAYSGSPFTLNSPNDSNNVTVTVNQVD